MFARRRQSLQWSSSLTHLTCACRSREEVSVHSNHMPLGMCTSQQSNACEHFLVICSSGAKIIKREISLSKKWVGRAKAGLFFVHIDVHVEGIDWECNNSRWMKELGFGYSEVKAVGFQYSNRPHRRKRRYDRKRKQIRGSKDAEVLKKESGPSMLRWRMSCDVERLHGGKSCNRRQWLCLMWLTRGC